MSELNNTDFYLRREQQERALAARAQSPAIRDIHLQLADRYVALIARAQRMTTNGRTRLHLVD